MMSSKPVQQMRQRDPSPSLQEDQVHKKGGLRDCSSLLPSTVRMLDIPRPEGSWRCPRANLGSRFHNWEI